MKIVNVRQSVVWFELSINIIKFLFILFLLLFAFLLLLSFSEIKTNRPIYTNIAPTLAVLR